MLVTVEGVRDGARGMEVFSCVDLRKVCVSRGMVGSMVGDFRGFSLDV